VVIISIFGIGLQWFTALGSMMKMVEKKDWEHFCPVKLATRNPYSLDTREIAQ
jgi:hypothetical protein